MDQDAGAPHPIPLRTSPLTHCWQYRCWTKSLPPCSEHTETLLKPPFSWRAPLPPKQVFEDSSSAEMKPGVNLRSPQASWLIKDGSLGALLAFVWRRIIQDRKDCRNSSTVQTKALLKFRITEYKIMCLFSPSSDFLNIAALRWLSLLLLTFSILWLRSHWWWRWLTPTWKVPAANSWHTGDKIGRRER